MATLVGLAGGIVPQESIAGSPGGKSKASGGGGWVDGPALPEAQFTKDGVVASGAIDRLYAVWGSAPNDVWAVGSPSAIVHWNGTEWSSDTVPLNTPLYGVWGSAANDVWAVGGAWDPQMLHYDGKAWSKREAGLPSNIPGAIWGSGTNDVWVVGGYGAIYHWNGTAWTNVKSPTEYNLKSVWGSGPDDVWAVGDARTVIHWNGSEWSTAVPSRPMGSHLGVSGSGPNDVWIAGEGGTMLHWKGSGWLDTKSGADAALESLWVKGPKDAWVGGQGVFLHWDGKAWFPAWGDPSGHNAKHAVGIWGTAASGAWAVGMNAGSAPDRAWLMHLQP
jgi:hypothetical protein